MLPQLLVNGLIAGSIYALVALGFGLIYSTTRYFHFARRAVCTVGVYLAYAGASSELLAGDCIREIFL